MHHGGITTGQPVPGNGIGQQVAFFVVRTGDSAGGSSGYFIGSFLVAAGVSAQVINRIVDSFCVFVATEKKQQKTEEGDSGKGDVHKKSF